MNSGCFCLAGGALGAALAGATGVAGAEGAAGAGGGAALRLLALMYFKRSLKEISQNKC